MKIVLVALAAATVTVGACTAVGTAVAQVSDPNDAVAAPTEAPSPAQQRVYSDLRTQVVARLGPEAAGDDLLARQGATSAVVNDGIVRYRRLLSSTAQERRSTRRTRAHPATLRLLGQYTTMRRRVMRRVGKRAAGYNLRHGVKVCFGKRPRACHHRPASSHEVARRIRAYRRILLEHARRKAAAAGPGWPLWVANAFARIRVCESGNNPRAFGVGAAAGHYGLYQFDLGTWASVGGSGNPANASRAEQDRRAYLLYKSRGFQPWECARIVGLL